MQLADFDFDLPKERIAQIPCSPRDAAKMLYVAGGALKDLGIKDIIKLAKPGDVMVFNNTKVIPTFLNGYIINSLRRKSALKIHLHKNHKNLGNNTWSCFVKPARKLHNAITVFFADDFVATVSGFNQNTNEFYLSFTDNIEDFYNKLEIYGQMPLPPYIKRQQKDMQDDISYQTVYAKYKGAVAAPTAGLHFTDQMLQQLQNKGIKFAFVTLHVGGGTFLPVKHNIQSHQMHSESYYADSRNCDIINDAIEKKNRVIAVGTTTLRVLETIAGQDGLLLPQQGSTDIFIYPGYQFKTTDVLITNFHLPKSSLIMLVCAFASHSAILNAYSYAVDQYYRFFSYGDACWLEKTIT